MLTYQFAICHEWTMVRGYKDTCLEKTLTLAPPGGWVDINITLGGHGEVRSDAPMPAWWGDYEVHSSHRSALLGKDPEWYGQWGWDEIPGQAYVWPVGRERVAG